jgi:phosphoenolpyruvate carboxykinase (ATP)
MSTIAPRGVDGSGGIGTERSGVDAAGAVTTGQSGIDPAGITVPGINRPRIYRNLSAAKLYEYALTYEEGSAITAQGALTVRSGEKTGRSPRDKRIVEDGTTREELWWGEINQPCSDRVFLINRERAIDYLNTRKRLFVVDAFAGWDGEHRFTVRVVCERAYHALFMSNMLITPTEEELAAFGEPEFVIYNAGSFSANSLTQGMTSKTSVDIDFTRREMVILGTEYAGEMKKGVFTYVNYRMPKAGILSMHCSANEGREGDVCLFFGLSGTGKTTLSADASRKLIGDDEHCWTPNGVFNVEGGCYAKCIDLDPAGEPEIYGAIRFGAVLENVVYDPLSRVVDFFDDSITQNTRCSYPIGYIPNAKIPCAATHPKNIIFLTCDAFGVLPPVSRLTPEQGMYHFISGYTAKIAGTEEGVLEPQATFSACFGAAFLPLHPSRYAELLAEYIEHYGAAVWLVNTGWTGGGYGVGRRIPLAITRRIVGAIHSGELAGLPGQADPVFGFEVKTTLPGVPTEMLWPEDSWASAGEYHRAKRVLAQRFRENFHWFERESSPAIRRAGPG